MRVLSLNLREALFAQESDEVAIFLVKIEHPSLTTPIYLSTDPTELAGTAPLTYKTVSRGTDYTYAGIDITIPDEQDKSPPVSKLTIQNVTRDLVPLARSVSTPAQATIEAVLASDLDTVEMTWPIMDMTSLTYDASNLVFTLTVDSLATEPYPAGNFSPAYFPGLFY